MKAFNLFIGIACLMGVVNAQTKIEVEVNKPLYPVSKNLYGIFFEDINHAGDGGLYAELINNRSFEANRMPEDMHRVGVIMFFHSKFLKFIILNPMN